MPIAWAAAPAAAAIAFTSIAVPVSAPSLDVVPAHPAIAAHGWAAFVAQDGKKRCEVSLWHVESGRAVSAYRAPCEHGDVFYNVIPGPDGDTPELVALDGEGVVRVFPEPRARVIRQPSFPVVAPAVRAPGPDLWLAHESAGAPLTLAIPSLTDISLWQRDAPGAAEAAPVPAPAADGAERWHRGDVFHVAVDAEYDPRIGRDSLSPDFSVLAHLRMPKWALGQIDASGTPGLLYALENEVTGTHAENGTAPPKALFHAEKVLFADDPNGNDPRLVRGNRLADIDGDGQLDVALVAARGGITHLETAMEVWFGPLAESLNHDPDMSLRGTGAAVGTELVDLVHDSRLSVLRPKVEVSIAAFVRILLFGEVHIDYQFFDVVRGEHGNQQPFCSFERPLPVDLEGLSAKAAPLFTTEGDFNGDGLADVLTGEGTKGYVILRGKRGDRGRWCAAADEPQPIPVAKAEGLTVVDLDGDGRSDLIAIHAADHGDSTVTLLLSTHTP